MACSRAQLPRQSRTPTLPLSTGAGQMAGPASSSPQRGQAGPRKCFSGAAYFLDPLPFPLYWEGGLAQALDKILGPDTNSRLEAGGERTERMGQASGDMARYCPSLTCRGRGWWGKPQPTGWSASTEHPRSSPARQVSVQRETTVQGGK